MPIDNRYGDSNDILSGDSGNDILNRGDSKDYISGDAGTASSHLLLSVRSILLSIETLPVA
ncbi:hypothetical protein W03_04000 [Nitrosomonas sp. PY1]|uniref:hypothetical protein n=1 Tax=Nitrosomonas sp. PY1 TaxID=1803906 RepID=UPI001FC8C9D0|nr:hypothetical protein [Nitrosomonas sp. PY1]GKS68396.1 hypothetical protein W03_04000 [Nitrosomonas sp. PY1]